MMVVVVMMTYDGGGCAVMTDDGGGCADDI